MTDENLAGESPAEDVPLSPAESKADSSPATDAATDETPKDADDAGKPERDESGKFVSPKAQKRIDHLTWEKDRLAREAEYWRQQAMQPPKAAEPEKPAEPVKMPSLADYEYDEAKYQAALVTYAEKVAERKAEQVLAEREQAAAQKAREQSFREREAKFKAANPDYESVAYYAPISDQVVDLIRDSDEGPELAYFLGKNPELAKTISQLPERVAAKEIGKIEARLAFEREAKAKAADPPPVSKAPTPPPRLAAANAEPQVRTTDPTGDALSDDEWVKAERKRLAMKAKRTG